MCKIHTRKETTVTFPPTADMVQNNLNATTFKKIAHVDRRYVLCILGGISLILAVGVCLPLFGEYFLAVNESHRIEKNIVQANISLGINLHDEAAHSVDDEALESNFKGRFHSGQMRPLTDAETVEFEMKENAIPMTMGEFMAKPSNRHNAMDLDVFPFPSFEEHKKNIESLVDKSLFSNKFMESLNAAKTQKDIDHELEQLMKTADDQIARTASLENKTNNILTKLVEKTAFSLEAAKRDSKADLDVEMSKADQKFKRLSLEKQHADGLLNALGQVMEAMTDTDSVMLSLQHKTEPTPSNSASPMDVSNFARTPILSSLSFDSSNLSFFSPRRFVEVSQIQQEEPALHDFINADTIVAAITSIPDLSMNHVTEGSFFQSLWEYMNQYMKPDQYQKKTITKTEKERKKPESGDEGLLRGLFSSLIEDYFKEGGDKSKMKSLDVTEDTLHGRMSEEPGDRALKDKIKLQDSMTEVTHLSVKQDKKQEELAIKFSEKVGQSGF